jgi:hypothetical protein
MNPHQSKIQEHASASFEGKRIVRVDAGSVNSWTFYLEDDRGEKSFVMIDTEYAGHGLYGPTVSAAGPGHPTVSEILTVLSVS